MTDIRDRLLTELEKHRGRRDVGDHLTFAADILTPVVENLMAEAWDRGYQGCCEITPEENQWADNPYRHTEEGV